MSHPRIFSIFEGKETKRARIEAEIVERSERFRACPTVKIGSVTVINPTYEGPNPFEIPELLDPENEGVLIAETLPPDPKTVLRSIKPRDRAKSEAYTKTPWVFDEQGDTPPRPRNPRHSAPPLSRPASTVSSETMYDSGDDPFRKDPLSRPTAGNSFLAEGSQIRRRTVGYSVDYLKIEIPDSYM
ncbi:hypothetical protein K438DRAFT_1958194 [Mycena galopus ATCC 62051]|nr:hypothetical protein K438DRAFT_1958194 [Mycena galopus ATCC 62051]